MATGFNDTAVQSAPVGRRRFQISGLVQGVGFRPYVYRLATHLELTGFVANDSRGVLIEVEGPVAKLNEFQLMVARQAPPLARIDSCQTTTLSAVGADCFRVTDSIRSVNAAAVVCPDIAVCDDCLRELQDSEDRRFEYPFINCTNCGPRFTITTRMPYDRAGTSMAKFDMCPACAAEYEDPGNRRFHAQPIACPSCGPRIWLHDGDGVIVSAEPLADAGRALGEGKIVAIRGLGGFHLAADAGCEAAVDRLRRGKFRDQKPFALMARDLASAGTCCQMSEAEQDLLLSSARPIVILPRRQPSPVAETVAPGMATLGVMLPYTPLHHLLFQTAPNLLVMTSGNLAEEPIAVGNDEALDRLRGIADLFVLHDREIVQRCDDSVLAYYAGGPRPIRRARGLAPLPVVLPDPLHTPILAVGGEQKNTVALGRARSAFLSQHLGDLDNPAAAGAFVQTIDQLCALLQLQPAVIACDLHPDYHAGRWARRQTALPVQEIQHHHAHLCSAMAENGVVARTIGIILDGTGYGSDGTIWGGEVLLGDFQDFERFAWLKPLPLLGGEAAVKEPWRMALAYLWMYAPDHPLLAAIASRNRITPRQLDLLHTMYCSRLGSPVTSSCGRLFDGIAALLGLADINAYEAAAAIGLETACGSEPLTRDTEDVKLPAGGPGPIDLGQLIRTLAAQAEGRVDCRISARLAHRLIADTFVAAAQAARTQTGITQVALSGGVFQNRLLTEYMRIRLQQEGFTVLLNSQVPCNDGGLALGQLAAANARRATIDGKGT